MMEMPEPENGRIVLAVYQFADLTGQQKPNLVFGEMSKAVTQGSSNLLIKALKDVGDGKWFRVVERESLQSLLQERKLIRTTRQITQGDKAKPLGPMLYAGAYLTGGIIGYDSNTLSGGYGHRILGIGYSAQYRQDTVTVMLRLINVVSGEVELVVMMEKTIVSVGAGRDKFTYLDLDTKLLEVELGGAINEPVTYAVRKTIEGAVVELVTAGEKKGLWKYKPEPWKDPGKLPEVKEIEVEIPTDKELLEELMEELEKIDEDEAAETAEILEELIEADKETRAEVKEKASQPAPVEEVEIEVKAVTTPAPQPEQVDEPVKVKVEPISDGILCTSSTHHFGCTEVSNEETTTSTDTAPSGN